MAEKKESPVRYPTNTPPPPKTVGGNNITATVTVKRGVLNSSSSSPAIRRISLSASSGRSSVSPKVEWSSTLRSDSSKMMNKSTSSLAASPSASSVQSSKAKPRPTSLRIDLTKKEVSKQTHSVKEIKAKIEENKPKDENMETGTPKETIAKKTTSTENVSSLEEAKAIPSNQNKEVKAVETFVDGDHYINVANSPIPHIATPILNASIFNTSSLPVGDEWALERRELQNRARKAERKLAFMLIFSATRRRKEKLMRWYFNRWRAACRASAPLPSQGNDDVQVLAKELLARLKSIRGDYT